MGEKTLAEKAAEVMGWVRYRSQRGPEMDEWCVPHKHTRGLTGTTVRRCKDFDPEHDANHAIEFAEWARRERGLSWAMSSWGRQVLATAEGQSRIRKSLPHALTEVLLDALEQNPDTTGRE